jgi:hypothetical protein
MGAYSVISEYDNTSLSALGEHAKITLLIHFKRLLSIGGLSTNTFKNLKSSHYPFKF